MTHSITAILFCVALGAAAAKAQTSPAQTQSVAPDSITKPTASALVRTSPIVFVANPDRIVSLDSLLKPYRGRVVYLDFWGTWCAPCRKEMPYSARLKEKFKGQPVDFLYVAYENGYNAKVIAKWKATVRQLNITGYHFMMNPEFEGGLTEYLEVNSYPRYVIIDKTGEILNANAPRPSAVNTITQQLRAAIAE